MSAACLAVLCAQVACPVDRLSVGCLARGPSNSIYVKNTGIRVLVYMHMYICRKRYVHIYTHMYIDRAINWNLGSSKGYAATSVTLPHLL